MPNRISRAASKKARTSRARAAAAARAVAAGVLTPGAISKAAGLAGRVGGSRMSRAVAKARRTRRR